MTGPCMYGDDVQKFLSRVGLVDIELVENNTFEVAGTTIGFEICLDHSVGELNHSIDGIDHVDVQLVVSAGTSIAAGPVRTAQHGPTFLVDGFGSTEINLNWYGRGAKQRIDRVWREPMLYDFAYGDQAEGFDVGPVFKHSFLSGLKAALWDTSDSFDSAVKSCESRSHILESSVTALDDWKNRLDGYFLLFPYEQVNQQGYWAGWRGVGQLSKPSLDIYEPVKLRLQALREYAHSGS